MAQIAQSVDGGSLYLTPEDRLALMQMGYGENVGQPEEVIRMTLQSALNRWLSPRDKEFGSTLPEVLRKGYYAVRKPNYPYTEASSGKFTSEENRRKFERIGEILDDILKRGDLGEAMFYFTPEAITRMKKRGTFDFDKVRALGSTGKYETFAY
jgi:hypothetical protein